MTSIIEERIAPALQQYANVYLFPKEHLRRDTITEKIRELVRTAQTASVFVPPGKGPGAGGGPKSEGQLLQQALMDRFYADLIEHMEEGASFDEAVAYAQSIGIAETDPSGDIDGWDAAIKVAALAIVLMGVPLKPKDVQREGSRALAQTEIQAARKDGGRWKLVCRAERAADGVSASVSPQIVRPESPLFSVNGTSSFVLFNTDVLPGLGIQECDPGPDTTAYGLLADMLNILRRD